MTRTTTYLLVFLAGLVCGVILTFAAALMVPA